VSGGFWMVAAMVGVPVFSFWFISWSVWVGKCPYTWTRNTRFRDGDGVGRDHTVPMRCTFKKGHSGPHGTKIFDAPTP
jgi:hypothetical protein